MFIPSAQIVPFAGLKKPIIKSTKVVFPDPLSPNTPMTFFSGIFKFVFLNKKKLLF